MKYLLLISCLLSTQVIGMQMDIKPLPQSLKIKNLCGATCAEMILKYYGERRFNQYHIGKSISKMIIPYKNQFPAASGALEFQWPDYKETYQPILALYFKNLGYSVENTRTYFNKNTGVVNEKRFQKLVQYVEAKIPVIIHIEKHYMLVVGYDSAKNTLILNDPANGKQLLVDSNDFQNRNTIWYKKRKGWDGRLMAVWK